MHVKIPSRTETLTDGKILLRPYRYDDAEDIYAAVRESLAEMYPWMPWAHKDYTLDDSRRWLKNQSGEWASGSNYEFAIVDARNGRYLGGCGINRVDSINRWANLGYWVRSSQMGKGVAAAAAVLLADWGFRELGLNRLEIMAATGNPRSQRVAEKTGAKREGILRNRLCLYEEVHDAVLFSLVPEDLAQARKSVSPACE
jgi:ribosomal-protein-serine acetyltransferase